MYFSQANGRERQESNDKATPGYARDVPWRPGNLQDSFFPELDTIYYFCHEYYIQWQTIWSFFGSSEIACGSMSYSANNNEWWSYHELHTEPFIQDQSKYSFIKLWPFFSSDQLTSMYLQLSTCKMSTYYLQSGSKLPGSASYTWWVTYSALHRIPNFLSKPANWKVWHVTGSASG